MLNYIVLGQIPGTNLHFGFMGFLLFCAILAAGIFGYRLYRAPFDHHLADVDDLEEIAL